MASTALHSDTTARIATLKQRRDLIEAQIMRVITGGQSISTSGAMSITQVPLGELRKELEKIKREILLLTAGASGNIILPDFSHEDSRGDEDIP